MKIAELCEMQRKFDVYVVRGKGLGDPYGPALFKKTVLALIVEIAEFVNETRCFKYWSSKPASPKEVIMEELADCLHFILRIINYGIGNAGLSDTSIDEIMKIIDDRYPYVRNDDLENIVFDLLDSIVNSEFTELMYKFVEILYKMEYTAEEIEAAYVKKNKVNYNRQVEGY